MRVVESQHQFEPGVIRGDFDGFVEFVGDAFGQPFAPADLREADVVLHHLAALCDEILSVERHAEVDFLNGALPIFDGEAVKREHFEFEPGSLGDDQADGFGAFAMTQDARQAASLSPAPVAIHDDGDMARQRRGRQA